jgi:pre-rRNA-processing protein TSR3
MRSSGSTRSRSPDRPIRLLLLLAGEDHPKACTGRRLVRRGAARPIGAGTRLAGAPVVLDPYAARPLSASDVAAAEKGGLLAVDCSWNRLGARGRFPTGREGPSVPRRLPFLVAANPQHYGRVGELNTVEALSGALYVLGRVEEAAHLLEGFRGGDGFLEVNRERLERFRACDSAEEIVRSERELFGPE